MSRVAKMPVNVPQNVEILLSTDQLTVKGSGGTLSMALHPLVKIANVQGQLQFEPDNETAAADSMSGTMRQLANNMIIGVTKGFEKKLNLVGVGFKAQANNGVLNISVGYSHPVNKNMPTGITVVTPIPTEITIKGADRQLVGQVAAEIRAIRPPEPYKGKGIRYADEKITIKETKKK